MGRINPRAESTFRRSYLVSTIKKSIKFVVSFSLLSFLVSYFSLITLFLRSSFFSSLTSPIFTHSWDKNYMFLLCNGILVILGSHSGLFAGSSSDIAEEHSVRNVSIQPPEKIELKPKPEPGVVLAVAEQEVAMICGREEVIDNGFSIAVEDDRDNEFSIVSYEDQIKEQQEKSVIGFQEEEEAELMSAEELNKKCDEFIMKMKRGIKWESQQLVMVQ